MQNEGLNKIYTTLVDVIPKSVLTNKNRAKTWEYGFNEKYGIVIISRTGQIGEIIQINGVDIALPLQPKIITKRHTDKS